MIAIVTCKIYSRNHEIIFRDKTDDEIREELIQIDKNCYTEKIEKLAVIDEYQFLKTSEAYEFQS